MRLALLWGQEETSEPQSALKRGVVRRNRQFGAAGFLFSDADTPFIMSSIAVKPAQRMAGKHVKGTAIINHFLEV
jgi:hypothetical protein